MSEYKPTIELIKLLDDGTQATLSHNDYSERVYFDGVPPQGFRDFLKKNKWKYSGYNHYWYRWFDEQSWNALLEYCQPYQTLAYQDYESSDDKDEEQSSDEDPFSSDVVSPYDDFEDDEELPFSFGKSDSDTFSYYADSDDDDPEDSDTVEITYSDIVVRKNGFYCSKHHEVYDVVGEIGFINRVGNMSYKDVPLAYCETCNVYYMLDETYERLKEYGVYGCQILTEKQYQSELKRPGDFGYGWKESSDLRNFGYTVSENEGLSTAQRRAILRNVLDQGVLSKDRVLSYLDFFQETHGSSDRAKALWREDREYIAQYQLHSVPVVRIKRH